MPEPIREQVPERIIEDPEAARALMNISFLAQFREPASPSAVARTLDMPANLAHHHAQRALRLGLLFEAGRERGRVLYQLTALRFKFPRELAEEAGHQADIFERSVRRLTEAYLDAYGRSEGFMDNQSGRWSICSFGSTEKPVPPPVHVSTSEPRPALFTQRTFKLTPEAYRRLLLRITALIQEETSERDDPRAAVCTIAALGFDGVAHEGLTDDTQTYSTFFTGPDLTGPEEEA